MATRSKMIQIWTCRGRNGSGCGWVYESPIPITSVGHKCKDGKFRAATKTGKRMAEMKGADRNLF